MGAPLAIDYLAGSERGGEVVLVEDDDIEEGVDGHLGNLYPFFWV
jgi:hypothetical protein